MCLAFDPTYGEGNGDISFSLSNITRAEREIESQGGEKRDRIHGYGMMMTMKKSSLNMNNATRVENGVEKNDKKVEHEMRRQHTTY